MWRNRRGSPHSGIPITRSTVHAELPGEEKNSPEVVLTGQHPQRKIVFMIEKTGSIDVTAEDFQEKVANSEVPVLVDWWAPWCGPCRMLAPTMDKLAEEFAGRAKVAKVNCDNEGNFARGHAIHSLPTITIWKSGEEKVRLIGMRTIAEYRKMIEENL